MTIGSTVIITKEGNYKNVVATIIGIQGNFGTVKIKGETFPKTFKLNDLKGLKHESK